MPTPKAILVALALAPVVAAEALAADPQRCLSPQQRRAAIADNRAVPLGQAVRSVREQIAGDVVRARLCESNGALVYLLTVLSRDGKVTRAAVDASNGQFLDGR